MAVNEAVEATTPNENQGVLMMGMRIGYAAEIRKVNDNRLHVDEVRFRCVRGMTVRALGDAAAPGTTRTTRAAGRPR
jgi:hypothetical protein